MNICIDKIKVLVIESFLYNNDETKNKYLNGEILGVSTYPNQTMTFNILIDGKYLYSDMPIHSFVWKVPNEKFTLKDLVYSNCDTLPIDNYTFNNFINSEVYVFLKKCGIWIKGEYITSFDFYEGNDCVHLIKLNNGYFTLAPNHKINWIGETELSDYKKNKTVWKINER